MFVVMNVVQYKQQLAAVTIAHFTWVWTVLLAVFVRVTSAVFPMTNVPLKKLFQHRCRLISKAFFRKSHQLLHCRKFYCTEKKLDNEDSNYSECFFYNLKVNTRPYRCSHAFWFVLWTEPGCDTDCILRVDLR